MSKTDHLARAKDYIAIAESSDSKREAYSKAREELLSVRADMTIREIADNIGKGKSWVSDLLSWEPSERGLPFERDEKDTHHLRQHRDAGRVLSEADEQTVEEIVAALPAKAVERIVKTGTDRLVENARVQRAEYHTEPTLNELTGGERFDPSEFWADTLIIRVNGNARELESLLRRGGGLRLGTMPIEEAFEYLHEAEKLIAEARAAAQERAREAVA